MSEENLLGGVLQAQVRVESLPASRQIVAVERQLDGTWRVCGYGQSGGDGFADLTIRGLPSSTIYALAVDDWGASWTANQQVVVGDVVRPSNFIGWLYRVTQALPATEPAWWNSASLGPQPVGTAALRAERYYQPLAHGPLDVDFESGFDPYWPQVISLIHFDGSPGLTAFFDEKMGVSWTGGGQLQANPAADGGSEIKLSGLDRDGVRPPAGFTYNYDVLSEPFSLEFTYQRGSKNIPSVEDMSVGV